MGKDAKTKEGRRIAELDEESSKRVAADLAGMKRTPLQPRADDNPAKVAELAAQGRNADMSLKNATPAEAQAQTGKKAWNPAFPAWLVRTALIVASVCALAQILVGALALPVWVPFAVFALGSLAAFLAGLDSPMMIPRFPILSPAFALGAGGAATALVKMAGDMEAAGLERGALLLIATLLAGAAGKALPQPKGKTEADPKADK